MRVDWSDPDPDLDPLMHERGFSHPAIGYGHGAEDLEDERPGLVALERRGALQDRHGLRACMHDSA